MGGGRDHTVHTAAAATNGLGSHTQSTLQGFSEHSHGACDGGRGRSGGNLTHTVSRVSVGYAKGFSGGY